MTLGEMIAAAQQTPRAVREARRRLVLRRFARLHLTHLRRDATDRDYLELGGEAGGA